MRFIWSSDLALGSSVNSVLGSSKRTKCVLDLSSLTPAEALVLAACNEVGPELSQPCGEHRGCV